MEKLFLVDGSNLLFQMFYGMPSRIVNKRGKAIHGTLGFIGALLKMIRMIEPTHVAVLFDGEHHNERKDIDEAYKANRIDYSAMAEEETPFSQLPDIYAALDFLQIKHTETMVCEADDWIASYARRYGTETKVVISSFDSDFFQLISENVTVLRYRGEKSTLYNEAYIQEKFGVSPKRYADFKAMVGDTADNIKGIPHVGIKTASRLLQEYGDLENILKNAVHIKQERIRTAILDGEGCIRKNQKLIRLEGCAELPFTLAQLRYTYNGVTTREVLSAIGL